MIGMITATAKGWQFEPFSDDDRRAIMVQALAVAAEQLHVNYTYTMVIRETGGKVPNGVGHECIITIDFIRTIDMPLEALTIGA